MRYFLLNNDLRICCQSPILAKDGPTNRILCNLLIGPSQPTDLYVVVGYCDDTEEVLAMALQSRHQAELQSHCHDDSRTLPRKINLTVMGGETFAFSVDSVNFPI